MATASDVQSFGEFRAEKEPTEFIFEDDQCVVFDEKINKQAPIHFLVVPKKVIPRLINATIDDEKLLGHMLVIAKQFAIEKGLDRTGYHVMVNENHQSNKLKSLHVFERALHHMVWPLGPGSRL